MRDQSLKFSEIAPNFGRFLPFKILRVRAPENLYPYSPACLAARHLEKSREVTPTGPKFITANTLNFKPI